jgi:hypothetical protein
VGSPDAPPAAAPSPLNRGQRIGKGLAVARSVQAFSRRHGTPAAAGEGRERGRRARRQREVDAEEEGGSVGMARSSSRLPADRIRDVQNMGRYGQGIRPEREATSSYRTKDRQSTRGSTGCANPPFYPSCSYDHTRNAPKQSPLI